MREWRIVFFLVALVPFMVGCGDDDVDTGDEDLRVAETELTGASEVPPVTTGASGQATSRLVGNSLDVTGTFSGLESDLFQVGDSSAHIHQGAPDESGPVVFDLEVNSADRRSGTLSGSFELSDEELQLFEQGLLYINVHTEANPGGEIRGQLDPN